MSKRETLRLKHSSSVLDPSSSSSSSSSSSYSPGTGKPARTGSPDGQLWNMIWGTDLEPFDEGDHAVNWKSQRTAINNYCDILDEWGFHPIADRVERCSSRADVYKCGDHGDVHINPCLCRQDRVCPVCASRSINNRAQISALRTVLELSLERGSPYLACWELTLPPHLWKRNYRGWKSLIKKAQEWIKRNYTENKRYCIVMHYWESSTPNSGEKYPHLHLVVTAKGRYKLDLDELDDMKRSWGDIIGWMGTDEDGGEVLPVCEYHFIPIPRIETYMSKDLQGIPLFPDLETLLENNHIPESVMEDLGSTVQRCFHRFRYMMRSYIWDLQPFLMEPGQVDGDVLPLIEGPGGKGANYVRWGQGWKSRLTDYEVQKESLLDPEDNPRFFCQREIMVLGVGGIHLQKCGLPVTCDEGIHIQEYQDRGPPGEDLNG